MQGLELRERECEERRVGRVAVGERDCLCRLDVAVAEPLDYPRPDRNRGGDLLRIAPPHLQALQPVIHLVRRQLPCQSDQSEPPGGDVELVLLGEGA